MLSKKDKISYLAQIANGIIPILIISLLARNSGLSFLGDYFFALSIIGSAQAVVDYGFNLSGVRSFASLLERRAAAADIWSLLISIVAAKLMIAALLAAAIMVYAVIAAPDNILYVASCAVVGVLLSVTNAAPLIFALKQSIRLSIAIFVARVVFVLPLFVIQPSLLLALTVTFMPMLIANIYSFFIAGACINSGFRKVKIKIDVVDQFAAGRLIFFNSILASLIATTWPLILSHSLTRAELGAYGISDKIVRGLMTFVTPLPPFILASNRAASLVAIAGLVIKHRLYRVFLLVVLLAPVALIVLPDVAFRMLFGTAVVQYRVVLNVYALGFLFFFCDLVLYTYMIIAKREALYAPVVVVSFLLSLVIVYIFELYIYAPLISEALVALMLMLASFKIHKSGLLAR